jgi:hypothetical protein
VPVLYTFTNNILENNEVNLTWDTTSQPNAAFMYQLNWQLRPVKTTGVTAGWTDTPRPDVAWLNADGSLTTLAGNKAYIPALACISDKLPAPYGTLGADVLPGSTQITVTGIAANPLVMNTNTDPNTPYTAPVPGDPALPALPFPIVIANTVNGVQSTATERMTALSIQGVPIASGGVNPTFTITFNVRRNTATEGVPAPVSVLPSHVAGTRVMSTPLPIIPNDAQTFPAPYVVQTQAHMCVADHGFSSYDGASYYPATGGSLIGVSRLLYRTTIFDIGDGWVRVGQ